MDPRPMLLTLIYLCVYFDGASAMMKSRQEQRNTEYSSRVSVFRDQTAGSRRIMFPSASQCSSPCQNGGSCLGSLCYCTSEWKGTSCQYHESNCNIETLRRLGATGQIRCSQQVQYARSTVPFTCYLSCSGEFEFPPASAYTCDYATGTFTPSSIPRCNHVSRVERLECELSCQNGGQCVYGGRDVGNYCYCGKEWKGRFCQYPLANCRIEAIAAARRRGMNGRYDCSWSSSRGVDWFNCTISCSNGHFEYPPAELYTCDFETRQFTPNNFPRCISQPSTAHASRIQDGCTYACLNGGQCNYRGQNSGYGCYCPRSWKGPNCQYPLSNCRVDAIEALRQEGVNARYECQWSSGEARDWFNCTISCTQGNFEFPPAEVYTCDYATKRFTPPVFPRCIHPSISTTTTASVTRTTSSYRRQERCTNVCRNGGRCVFGGQSVGYYCYCPSNWKGPACQYPETNCKVSDILDKYGFNGVVMCKRRTHAGSHTFSCSLSCDDAPFTFPPAAAYTCDYATGDFTPSEFPKCDYENSISPTSSAELLCSPPCHIGGQCVFGGSSVGNYCYCNKEWKGPSCQYPASNCKLSHIFDNYGFNGRARCEERSLLGNYTFTCFLSCPRGTPTFEPAEFYSCDYATGQFTPSVLPKCSFDSHIPESVPSPGEVNNLVCSPPCEQGGSCVYGGASRGSYCVCREGWKGSSCQYPESNCKSSDILEKYGFNGRVACKTESTTNEHTYTCTLSCPHGTFTFPPSPSYSCDYATGQFTPSIIPRCRNVLPIPPITTVPDMQTNNNNNTFEPLVCHPPCENGGSCIYGGNDVGNYCFCANGWRGLACQYPESNCKSSDIYEKHGFLGRVECRTEYAIGTYTYKCILSCPHGTFNFPPSPFYICDYATRRFTPTPLPTCQYRVDIRPVMTVRIEQSNNDTISEPLACDPPCGNGGSCFVGESVGSHCICADGWRGPTCDFPENNCKASDIYEKYGFNGHVECKSEYTEGRHMYTCVVSCLDGNFTFSPSPSYTCDYATGDFTPSTFPRCNNQYLTFPEESFELEQPISSNSSSLGCYPPCQNGGSCMYGGTAVRKYCFCTNEWKGPACQYHESNCKASDIRDKHSFSGRIDCKTEYSVRRQMYTCRLSCPNGTFTFPPASFYICDFATAQFTPSVFPRCQNNFDFTATPSLPSSTHNTDVDTPSLLCDPPCQNAGACVYGGDTIGNYCSCSSEWRGPACEYLESNCKSSLIVEYYGFNGRVECQERLIAARRTYTCTLSCPQGTFTSPPSPLYSCDYATGHFTPSIFPSCYDNSSYLSTTSRPIGQFVTEYIAMGPLMCDPPCQNEGNCVYGGESFGNYCFCKSDWKGEACQYPASNCKLTDIHDKYHFNGRISCRSELRNTEYSYGCTLSCGEAEFSYPPADLYICDYATGQFTPSQFPRCIQRNTLPQGNNLQRRDCSPPCQIRNPCQYRDGGCIHIHT